MGFGAERGVAENVCMAIILKSYTLRGIKAEPVQVEVEAGNGMPIFSIVGMAGTSVQEAKDRIRGAISYSGFRFPLTRKIVNLAPAETPKSGGHFDLAIALGLLLATGQVEAGGFDGAGFAGGEAGFADLMVIGELGLNGEVRPARGALPAAIYAREAGIKKIILPLENFAEASLVSELTLVPVTSLREAVECLGGGSGSASNASEETVRARAQDCARAQVEQKYPIDFADISGHSMIKRALTVAAAGAHHILMCGPPGSGKSLLAQAFPSILPELLPNELLEVLQVYSVFGGAGGGTADVLNGQRPFRAVHHRATPFQVFGGGQNLSPGEVSLAHRGVLFLDEFPEFARAVMEGLREPLELGNLRLKFGRHICAYPCRFQLLAAQNPCPCGYANDADKACICSAADIARYTRKISGPILDRIDIQIEVPRISYEEFRGARAQSGARGESSAEMRAAVTAARALSAARFKTEGILTNQEMGPAQIKSERLCEKSEEILSAAEKHYSLSGRAISKVIKVARTIADLAGSEHIRTEHLLEALQYRVKR